MDALLAIVSVLAALVAVDLTAIPWGSPGQHPNADPDAC
jgi:hypothetical protein